MKALSRFCRCLIAVLLISPCVLTSQNTKDSKHKAFVSRTSLVLIPTVVTDHQGSHATGLAQDDFEVLEDKKPQKISVFEEIHTGPGNIRRVDPNDSGFTNVVDPSAKTQRLTLIVLDTLNTRFSDQVHARRELLKFVDETLQPGEPVALMTIGSNGLNVMNDFTTDPKELLGAVKKVRGQLSDVEKASDASADLETSLLAQRQTGRGPTSPDQIMDELQGFEGGIFDQFEQMQMANSVEITLRALRQIAESFAGVPGRKSLIWATGGLPFIADDPTAFSFRSAYLLPLYESTWTALNNSQISVYPLDMGGLFNPGFVSPRFGRVVRYRRMIDSVSNLETFAKMTGGKLCVYKMNLSGCFSDALKDEGQYYLIGYYPDSTKIHPGLRKLDVTVRRPQLEVRARTSYYVTSKPPDPRKSQRDDIDTAITSPVDFTSIPMLVRWTGRTLEGANTKLTFQFDVPGSAVIIDRGDNNLISLAFAAFAKTSRNLAAAEFAKELEGNLSSEITEQITAHGIVYDGSITVPPGKYSVRFMVRDNLAGRLGTVSVPLEVAASAPSKSP